MANRNELDRLLEKYAWSPLQIQQLRLAQKHGITLQYFHPQYDWEQLREIRLALEDGMDPSFLLDRHINSESMKNAREKVYETSGLYHEKAKAKRQKRIIIAILSCFIFSSLLVVALWQKDYILSMIYNIHLDLVSDRKTIGLSEIEDFHFIDLVKDYSKDCELVLPAQDISEPGEYNLRFTVKNQSKSISKSIVLLVEDDIKPVIELKKTKITLEYGQTYDFRSNIASASDNGKEMNIDDIEIKNPVDSKKQGKYEVSYEVEDDSGNKANEKAEVTVLAKEKEDSKSPSSSKKPTEEKKNSNSSSGRGESQTSSSKPRAENKIFLFEQYGDANATQKAALAYGNNALSNGQANRFECNPIKENGLYVGYEVVFS